MIEMIIHKKTESKEEIISYNLSSVILEDGKLLATKNTSNNYYLLDRLIGCDVQGSTSYEICMLISDPLARMKDCHKFYQFRDKDKLIEKLMEILF